MTTTNSTGMCCSSCATADNDTLLAIACTLDGDDFEHRIASIRELAARHLLSSRLTPLTLHLSYAADALPEIKAIVAKEETCCAFLDFVIQAGERVELTITAPEHAALAAGELFAHFAPELTEVAA